MFYQNGAPMARTLLIIKPDAVAKNVIGAIIQRLEENSFGIIELQKMHLTRAQAAEFYAVHRERPFYHELIDFMTSGPCVPMVLERDDAVPFLRETIGSTNPEEAAEGTIRKDFATNIQNNAVHASDSPENAAHEIAFFFGEKAVG
jgi:nucleoside-diphosphate kinase